MFWGEEYLNIGSHPPLDLREDSYISPVDFSTLAWKRPYLAFLEASAILAFPLLIVVLFSAIILLFARLPQSGTGADGAAGANADGVDPWGIFLSSSAFGLIGMVVALLYVTGGQDTLLTEFLPSIIVAAAFLFQMAGRLNRNWDVPLEGRVALSGAMLAALGFLFSAAYFGELGENMELLRLMQGADSAVGTGDNAGPDLGNEGIDAVVKESEGG